MHIYCICINKRTHIWFSVFRRGFQIQKNRSFFFIFLNERSKKKKNKKTHFHVLLLMLKLKLVSSLKNSHFSFRFTFIHKSLSLFSYFFPNRAENVCCSNNVLPNNPFHTVNNFHFCLFHKIRRLTELQIDLFSILWNLRVSQLLHTRKTGNRIKLGKFPTKMNW